MIDGGRSSSLLLACTSWSMNEAAFVETCHGGAQADGKIRGTLAVFLLLPCLMVRLTGIGSIARLYPLSRSLLSDEQLLSSSQRPPFFPSLYKNFVS
jgi:hypothetical protein